MKWRAHLSSTPPTRTKKLVPVRLTGCKRKYTDKQNNTENIIKLFYDPDRHTVVDWRHHMFWLHNIRQIIFVCDPYRVLPNHPLQSPNRRLIFCSVVCLVFCTVSQPCTERFPAKSCTTKSNAHQTAACINEKEQNHIFTHRTFSF